MNKDLLTFSHTNVFYYTFPSYEESKEKYIIDHVIGVEVSVPEQPLAPNALQITRSPLFATQQQMLTTCKKVVAFWQKHDISTDYLLYAKVEMDKPQEKIEWQMVPYPQKGIFMRFFNQVRVLVNTIFPLTTLSQEQREQQALEMREQWKQMKKEGNEAPKNEPNSASRTDAFCNRKIIRKQFLWSSSHVFLFYTHAPIALDENKIHFLVLPKRHCVRFTELTEEEYLEVDRITTKLVQYYSSRGYKITHIFHKNGVEAGQTVPHWHQHIIFTANKTQELWGKCQMLRNMLVGGGRLSEEEFKKRADDLRGEISKIEFKVSDIVE